MTIRASVELDSASRMALREAVGGVAPTILDTMRDAVDRIRLGAVDRWPVARPRGRSGRLPNQVHSRDRFAVVERVSSEAVEVALENGAPYAAYIRSTQNGLGNKGAWQTLVLRAAPAETQRIVEESGRELAALAGGGK